MTWMAGIRPIKMAESVKLLTKRGKTVDSEANPSPNPKKPPSITFTIKLNDKFLLCLINPVLVVVKVSQSSSAVCSSRTAENHHQSRESLSIHQCQTFETPPIFTHDRIEQGILCIARSLFQVFDHAPGRLVHILPFAFIIDVRPPTGVCSNHEIPQPVIKSTGITVILANIECHLPEASLP